MARCKKCIHYDVCTKECRMVHIDERTWYLNDYNLLDDVELFCNNYIATAGVAPKSEVERLQAEVKVLTENSITSKYPCCVSCSNGLILTKSLEEYDKLLADIANEVAREIFEEIDKTVFADMDFFKELKKKYTEGEK